ncbi:MAG: DUF169 domain-containing protein [Promethearchaeota archaeon]
MNDYQELKDALNLKYNPVGVKLIFQRNIDLINDKFKEPNQLERYCKFVKRAAKGEFIKVKKGNFSCVTAELMLGFKKPENIEFHMRLNIKGLKYILLFPINKYNLLEIDSIIIIVNPRNCMDIIEAYAKIYEKPLKITCGVITGVCSEVTAYVIKRKEINFSFLCAGSRIFAGFDDCDLLCGIPGEMIKDLVKEIKKIAEDRKLDIALINQLKENK